MTGMFLLALLLVSTGCMGTFPKPLTPEEEEKYIDKYLKGDKKAKDILIERNLRLVAHVAKKYSSSSAEPDDLISIGTIGLIKGISSYDKTRKTRLSTYAARCIDNEILMYLRCIKKYSGEMFLQDPVGKDKDGNEITVMETIPSSENFVDSKAEKNIQLKQLCKNIPLLLNKRELLIITLRYGLNGQKEMTQREIAQKLNISRSYVSRIEKKALSKLKTDIV